MEKSQKPRLAIDLGTLGVVLSSYDALRAGARNLQEVAESLGVEADFIYRSIARFEKHTDTKVFKKARGRGDTAILQTQESRDVMASIRQILNEYDHVVGKKSRRRRVTVAGSLTICANLLPHVTAPFCESNRDIDVEVIPFSDERGSSVRSDQPFDLILSLTDVQHDTRSPSQQDVIAECLLPLALAIPRWHSLTEDCGPEVSWDQLSNQTIIHVDEYGLYYLKEHVPDAVRFLRVDSFLVSNSMAAAGAGLSACIPQLLSPEQRGLLRIVEFPAGGSPAVRLQLQRGKSARPRDRAASDLVDDLESRLGEYLDKLKGGGGELKRLSKLKKAYYVGEFGEGHAWFEGNMAEWRFPDAPFFTGLHFMPIPDLRVPDQITVVPLFVDGCLTRSDVGDYHFVWRGMMYGAAVVRAAYAATCICDKDELSAGRLVGVWTGREERAAYGGRFVPSQGYFVLLSAEEAQDADGAKLNAIVCEHLRRFGQKPNAELPEKVVRLVDPDRRAK